MKKRVYGFDVARALAVFGMVIVNFKIAMNAETGNMVLLLFTTLFEGRASALFVILAGVGIVFLTDKARLENDPVMIAKSRFLIIKRGLLLVALGLLYTPVWEADILHFYGFYFLIASAVFTCKDRVLVLVAIVIALLFPGLMLFFDYEKNWDWVLLSYDNFWTLDGMIRHIFFNGFHPVIPWTAFLVLGMWLARQDLSRESLRKKLLFASALLLVLVEGGFYGLRQLLYSQVIPDLTRDEIEFLFSTSILPPMPQYLLSAACSAVLVLIGCLYFSEKYPNNLITRLLYQTGQCSLTLYVAHVIVGMGFLEAIGRLENQSITFSLICALLFCFLSIFFCNFWLKRFKAGPLEWCFRKLAG